MNAVQPAVGRGLLRRLCGFKGYPRKEGEDRFVEVLCEVSLSVEHCSAIIASFDADFPTLREIRDTAYNLRPRFEVTEDQRAKWEAEYGKPDPMWSRRMESATTANYPDQKRAMLWQAIRDSIYYTEGPGGRGPSSFWSDAMAKHNRNHSAEVAAFRVQLAEFGWDRLMAVDWLKSMPVMAGPQRAPVALANPITQADVDRELGRVGRESGDGE